ADWFRDRVALSQPGNHAFQVAADALVQLHAQATAQGTHVLMVLQESKEEVYLPELEDNVPDITRGLRDVFDSHGIDYLDLLPGLRERARAGEQLFFERDGHPNRRGYALDAALILAHLRENAAKYGLVQTGVKSAGNLPARLCPPRASGPQLAHDAPGHGGRRPNHELSEDARGQGQDVPARLDDAVRHIRSDRNR